ncbi:MAG: diguanylate cyclase/phosphodiesterase with sensor(s) [Frankiales bacterium]|nr:diguanylate cyclase/phosphodiesterase with sensor(s) [Frankiales bacterium]
MGDMSSTPGDPDMASGAQEALTESQTRAILERASDLSALLDAEGRVLWVSPALPALWGYTRESVLGAPMWGWIHPDDLADTQSLYRRVAEVPGAHDRIDIRLRDGGGDWRWTEQRFTNLLHDESVAAMVATTTDVTARRVAEIELTRQDAFFKAVFAGATDVAHVCDADTTFRWVSPSVQSVCGYEPAALLGTKRADLVHPAERAQFDAVIASVRSRPGSSERVETRVRHADGSWGWSEQRITNLLDDPVVRGLVFNNVDITLRKSAHEELQSREQFLRVVLETAHEGVWVLDADGRTVYANRRMAELLGVPVDMLVAHPLEDLVDPALAAEIRERLLRRAHGVAENYELRVRPHGTSESWVAISAAPLPAGFTKTVPAGGTVALVADITDRKAHEESLRQHALYDHGTGLPNRVLLAERQRALEERHARDGDDFSYLLCDVDGLRDVNNAFGSAEGDRLLREIGQRLVDASRADDCVARSTGDRFVVLCPGAETFQGRRLAEDLIAAVHGPVQVGGSTIWPSVSIGVASTADVQPDVLASAADSALYRAKRHGRGSVGVYDAAAPRDHRSSLEMLADLREATSTGALRLHYQPVVHTPNNRVIGAEALMRWKRPGHGDVPPSVFIPLAEEAGLIKELGAWSLRQACRDAASWPGQQHVAVNLSARQLLDESILPTVVSALDDSGLAAERLWIEVTETAVLADLPAAAGRLNAIADLGVSVSLDDFGTGYSSMMYLRDLPVHAIKIDRSFVAGVSRNRDDEVIVSTLVSLATTLGLRAIAEGIENIDQLHVLRRMGCEYAQGYLWSQAVPTSRFVAVVAEIESHPSADWPPRKKPSRHVDEVVRARVMSMHRQGASAASIASALNADALTSPSGKRWHRVTVAQLVHDDELSAGD